MLAILLLGVYCVEAALYVGLLLLTGLWWILPPLQMVLVIAGLFAGIRFVLALATFFLSWTFRTPKAPPMKLGPLSGVRLVLYEYLSFMRAFFVLQPFERLFRSMRRADTSGARETPVIFIHGFLCNGGYWQPLIRRLRREFRHLYTVNLEPPLASINRYARDLAQSVEEICRHTGATRVVLVGHSIGGLVARAYVQRYGGAERVLRIVTLASPHHGSHAARFAAGINAQQMRPGSAWLENLNAEPRAGVPITSIYSVDDNLVVPQDSARLDGAVNKPVQGVGHLAIALTDSIRELVRQELLETTAQDKAAGGDHLAR